MLLNNSEYIDVVEGLKQKIREAQYKAMVKVNTELIGLYWDIGKIINERSEWGNKFIENLSRDLRLAFPGATGYSVRNLKYMAKLNKLIPKYETIIKIFGLLPWGQTIYLLDKVDDVVVRDWYASKAIENGWSRAVLAHQIETDLYKRQVLAHKTTSFFKALPAPQSELAEQTMKDPYVFDFIPFKEKIKESEVERALLENITKFLLELDTGFAFLGNQKHIQAGERDFYIDLLFYNLKLRCHVVIELKAVEFEPEFLGKLNFYLSAVDSALRREGDNPTIGLLLCKGKDNTTVEYALRGISQPIGVSDYTIGKPLPKEVADVLPSVEDLKSHIGLSASDKKNIKLSKSELAVAKLFAENGNLTAEEIALKLNATSRTIQRNIQSLQTKGVIVRDGSKKSGMWIVRLGLISE